MPRMDSMGFALRGRDDPGKSKGKSKSVGKKSKVMQSLEGPLQLVQDLLGGTQAMRAAREKYLPKWEAEEPSDYNVRLNHTFLFAGFKKVLRSLVSKPFSRQIVFEGFAKEFDEWKNDIDLNGNRIDIFLRKVFQSQIADGVTLLLADMQKTVDSEGQPLYRNLKEQNLAIQNGYLRPYLVHINIRDVLGYKTEVNGCLERLTQIRIREEVEIPDPEDEFGMRTVEQIRVLSPGRFELWRKDERTPNSVGEDTYSLYDEGETFLNEIPIVPVFSNQTGFLTGVTPLEEVAWKNVECWQDASNQANSLAFARIPLMYITGVNTMDGPLRISPNTRIELHDPAGKVGYVEHTGAAIEAGERNAARLKEEMEIMGVSFTVRVMKTATQTVLDSEEEMSELRTWVIALEDALMYAFYYMAEFMHLDPEKSIGEVDIYDEFEIGINSQEDMVSILAMQKEGILDKRSVLIEAQRRRLISDKMKPEEILTVADQEMEESLSRGMGEFGSGIGGSANDPMGMLEEPEE